MTPPGTFERVYAAIKQRLRDGIYRPGDRLEPAVLSDELNASVTPVRDALHRLTGERLVEAPRHEGFRVPMMTETRLRQLFAWHRNLLLLAVMKRKARSGGIQSSSSDDPNGSSDDGVNAMFLALARSTGNSEYVAAVEASAEKLAPIRRLEEAFLEQTEEETQAIIRALRSGDRRALRKSLNLYHRRRDRIVPDLLALLLRD